MAKADGSMAQIKCRFERVTAARQPLQKQLQQRIAQPAEGGHLHHPLRLMLPLMPQLLPCESCSPLMYEVITAKSREYGAGGGVREVALSVSSWVRASSPQPCRRPQPPAGTEGISSSAFCSHHRAWLAQNAMGAGHTAHTAHTQEQGIRGRGREQHKHRAGSTAQGSNRSHFPGYHLSPDTTGTSYFWHSDHPRALPCACSRGGGQFMGQRDGAGGQREQQGGGTGSIQAAIIYPFRFSAQQRSAWTTKSFGCPGSPAPPSSRPLRPPVAPLPPSPSH